MGWFVEGYNDIIDFVKNSGDEKFFEITLLNKGGKGQPFIISNIPSWLKLSNTSGTINPNSKISITATIDKELTAGEYLENMYLKTDFGYDEKLQIKLRVLAQEPKWTIDPSLFEYSMNVVGRVKVDGAFSEDVYDKIAAFYNGELRGSVKLVYNQGYQEYFAFLTVYSNEGAGENIEFKIWDASRGIVLVAKADTKATIPFEENAILGKLSQPVVFENSNLVEQKITLNGGWTWVSLNVVDANFSNLNQLTKGLNLETDDRILSFAPSLTETYYKDNFNPLKSTWSGGITNAGGLSSAKMYKIYTTHPQSITAQGTTVKLSNWSFPILTNWNRLPYPIAGNQLTNEALAYFDAVDGDVIKSQNLFAVYDPIIGWNGTLKYLESGQGYMVRSSKAQTFKYPVYLSKTGKSTQGNSYATTVNETQGQMETKFMKYPENMNAVVLMPNGYNQLFVYDAEGVLKGSSLSQEVNNTTLSFMTIYGDASEKLVFYVGDGLSMKKTSKDITFTSNAVLGTISKPIILDQVLEDVSIFPNPFENELRIKLVAAKDQVVSMQLYSLTGQLLVEKNDPVLKGENILKIAPKVVTGTYLLQIEINGQKLIYKVVKK